MKNQHESAALTYSNSQSMNARNEIYALMNSYRSTEEEKERSLGLFLRGSLLARILAITDIYKQIVHIPGMIFDIGTWRGQTAVLCENLRAIYEPLHFNRSIICFDTFEGYKGFSDKDKVSTLHQDGSYDVGEDYAAFLRKLLELHEMSNAMGHNHGKHTVVKGDCRETIPRYFDENPNTFLALAFFDLNAYSPTLQAFEEVYKRLTPGGIIAFWQLTRKSIQAEAIVYTERILTKYPHTLLRSDTYPGLCYMVKK